MQKLRVFNKKTIDGQYPNGLAYSVHISIQGVPIRNEYGMLFPKGSVDENNRIVPAYAGEIRIASAVLDSNQIFVITGENWTEKGITKTDDSFWTWVTEEFISYELITEPVCISRPLYGFENTNGTINNEGPYAFYHRNMIYLAYSGGDARGYLYTVGMLTAEDGSDLCDLSVWKKAKTPILSFRSVPGEFGPGHNSFFCDRDGDWWIAYHGVTSFEERVISDGIRKIRYDKNERPRFV